MPSPSDRLPIVPDRVQVPSTTPEADGIREKLVKAIVIFVKGAASRILLIPSKPSPDTTITPTPEIAARPESQGKLPEGNTAMAIKDAKLFREAFHAFLFLFPSESQEPDNQELRDLRSIFQDAARVFEKLITTDAGAATMLGVNIRAKSSSFVVQGINKSYAIKDLFFRPSLGQIPLERLETLREDLGNGKKGESEKRQKLYGVLAEAKHQGIDGETLSNYMSRFNLIIEAYWQKLEEAIRAENDYRADAKRPHQALRTITEYTLEVLNRTLEQALWEEEGYSIDHHETGGARSGRSNDDANDHHVLPPPSTTLEELLEHAHELVIPAGMRQIDLLSRDGYLHGRVAASGIKRESLLDIINEEKLGLLLEIDHEAFRPLRQLKRNIQLLTVPADGPALPEEDSEDARLRAFVSRHLMLFKYKPEVGYSPDPSQWLSAKEGGEEQEQFQNELWYLYFTARAAFAQANSLEELLDIFLPGIDQEFLLRQSGQHPEKSEDPSFPFNRFRFWANAVGEFFDNIGRHDISLFLENFFLGLESRDSQAWDEVRLFENLKTIERSLPKERKGFEAAVREQALDPWQKLKDSGLQFLDDPKAFQDIGEMLEPLRKIDKWVRLIVRQHLLKVDPRLLTRSGKVVRAQKVDLQIDGNGKQVVSFVEAAPGELWVVSFDPHK